MMFHVVLSLKSFFKLEIFLDSKRKSYKFGTRERVNDDEKSVLQCNETKCYLFLSNITKIVTTILSHGT